MDAAAAAAAAAVDDDDDDGDNDAKMFACRRTGYASFINSFATSDRRSVRRRDGPMSRNIRR